MAENHYGGFLWSTFMKSGGCSKLNGVPPYILERSWICCSVAGEKAVVIMLISVKWISGSTPPCWRLFETFVIKRSFFYRGYGEESKRLDGVTLEAPPPRSVSTVVFPSTPFSMCQPALSSCCCIWLLVPTFASTESGYTPSLSSQTERTNIRLLFWANCLTRVTAPPFIWRHVM